VSAPARHPLAGLLGAQFLGAFNDNLLRVVVIFLLIGPEASEDRQQAATSAAFLAFTLPFIVLSLPAGVLADRVSKQRVVVGLKVLEICIMALCALALVDGRPWAVLAVLSLLGAQSALFSPAKYGILPELIPPERLSAGNGQIQLWTFLAIISGTAFGGILLDAFRRTRWMIGGVLGVLALLGYLFALRVPPVPIARREGGLVRTARQGWRVIRQSAHLRLGVAGNLWFWSLAALLQQDLVVYAKSVLDLSDTGKGLLLAALALGIALGSFAAGAASRGRIVLGHIPLGAAGMAVVTAAFGFLVPGFSLAIVLLLLLGAAAGFFVVPLNALIQYQAPAADRGGVIGVMNVLVFAGILGGSLAATALAQAGATTPQIMLVASATTLLGAAWIARWGPRALEEAA
jgi:acyl-[acyl-carrier-protein]-phospholipid O-acyltransferase / long-chain-fatty-acid--[acyl-carrier-protein] ligase